VWFAIFNFLSIHSKYFKGNENEENFWFDDPSNASTEEAVTARRCTKTGGRYRQFRGRYRKGDTGEIQENPEIFCPNGGYFKNQN
jgi:hypothetical protein